MRRNKNFKRLVIFAMAGILAILAFSAMNVSAATTLELQCDDTNDWSGSGASISVDNADYKEWDGSIKVDGTTSSDSKTALVYNPTGTWDFSNVDYVVFWLKDSSSRTITFTMEESDHDENQYTFTTSTSWKTHIIDISAHDTSPETSDGDGTFDWTDVDYFWIGDKSTDFIFRIDYLTIGNANDYNKWQLNKYDMMVRNVNKDKFYYFTGATKTTTPNAVWQAVNHASAGDTIEAATGTYSKQILVNTNGLTIKSIPLQGSAIIDTSSGTPSSAIEIRADDVTVDGFDIIGGGSVTTNYGARDCILFVENSDNAVLKNLDVQGAYLGSAQGGTNAKGYAIIYEDSKGDVMDSTISPNSVGDTNGIGIAFWDNTNVTVDNCIIENYGRVGIFAYANGNSCSGEILGSTIDGPAYPGTDTGKVCYGIEIESLATPVCSFNIKGNDISGNYNGPANYGTWGSAGIMIDGWDQAYGSDYPDSVVSIENNDIYNNEDGIFVVCNTVSYAHNNNIYNNLDEGLESADCGTGNYETFDAECNYWGGSNGPDHPSSTWNVGINRGDSVTDYVDYCPWLQSYPSGLCWGPVKNLNTGYYYASIQAAIDDSATSDGDVIEVSDGTYEENVVVTKGVTIQGGSKPTVDGKGGWYAFEIKHDDVTIKKFKITNSNPVSSFSHCGGILAWGYDNALITNCNIYGISSATLECYGINLYGTDDTTIKSNTINNIDDYGIVFKNGNDDITIEKNTIKNTDVGIGTYTSGSALSNIDIHKNKIFNNNNYGVQNLYTSYVVNATCNWWGSEFGPTHAANTYFQGSQGDAVSDYVLFCPWLLSAPYSSTCWGPIQNLNTGEYFASIQAAIDDSDTDDGDVIEVSDGTYTEGGITVTKEVTIQGGSKPIIDGAGNRYTFWIQADNVVIDSFHIKNTNPSAAANVGGILVDHHQNTLIKRCKIDYISSSNTDVGIYLWGTQDVTITNCFYIGHIQEWGIAVNGCNNVEILLSDISSNDIGVYGVGAASTNVDIHNVTFYGNDYGVKNDFTNVMQAQCNYWGDSTGPSGVGAGLGDKVSNYVDYSGWLSAAYWNPHTCWAPVKNLDTGEMFVSIQNAIDDSDTDDGDTIAINGTFNEHVDITKGIILQPMELLPTLGGWAGPPWPSPAVIDGAGFRYTIEINHDDVTIKNILITNSNPVCSSPTSYAGGILDWGNSGILIDGCDIVGISSGSCPTCAINFYGTDDSEITNTDVTNLGGYVGILLGNDNSGITIEENEIGGNDIGIYGRTDDLINIEVHYNNIMGNALYGIQNDHASHVIDAECNYWGDPSGPSGLGPGSGDAVTTNVDYDPWIGKLEVDADGPYETSYLTSPSSPSDYEITFDGDASVMCNYAPWNPTIISYHWDFGDGDTASIEDPTHEYDRGCYVATFTVTVQLSNTMTATYSDTATVWVKNTAPDIKDAYWDGPAWQENLWTDRPVLYLTTFCVPIEDYDDSNPVEDKFDYSITTSPDIGSVSVTNDVDGTKCITFSGLQWDTTYTITVTADDDYVTCLGKPDTGYATRTFTFDTAPEPCDVTVDDSYKYSTVGFGIDKFLTIQNAVDVVCDGGTITVMDGVYEGANVHKTVTLTGDSLPVDTALVQTPIIINADDVEVYNLAFEADENGAVIVNADGVIVQHNKFLKECIAGAKGLVNNGDMVDARYNYWGAVDGPSSGVDFITGHVANGFGVMILGDVRFDPFAGVNAEISKPPIVEVEAGTSVVFDGSGSTAYTLEGDPNSIDEYRWDFDDGTYSFDAIIGHTFDVVGNYDVALRIRAADIQLHNNYMYDWDYITICVISPGAPLSANADGENLGGYETIVNKQIQLYGEAVGGEGGYTYYWDFGDDTGTVEAKNPEHVYSEAGTYTATLTVTSGVQTATDTAQVLVKDIDELVVQVSDKSVVTGVEDSFTASVIGGEAPYTYEWDFGDGTSSTEPNPTHTYTVAGEYTITAIVTDNNAKTSSDTAIIVVEEGESTVDPVEIKDVTGGFGIKATIAAGSQQCCWNISVDGDYVFFGESNEGEIEAESEETVKLGFSIAIGKVNVTVKAGQMEKEYTAFALGPFYLNMQEA